MLGCGWEWFPFPLLPLGRTDAVGVLLTEDVTAVRPIEPRCRLGALDGIQLRDGMFVRVRLCEVGHLLLVPTPAAILSASGCPCTEKAFKTPLKIVRARVRVLCARLKEGGEEARNPRGLAARSLRRNW